MSQTETPEKQEEKTKKTRTAKSAKPLCHIHKKVGYWQVDDIRRNVCVNDEDFIEHTDGKFYCLFHLPTTDKDLVKFKEKFKARLTAVEDQLAAAEKLPEPEREKAGSDISYDFRFVWFPSEVNFFNYKFSAFANFIYATFAAEVNFISAKFAEDAYFILVTFSADTDFSSAIFSDSAVFRGATFSSSTYFRSAIFSTDAYFSSVKFLETSQTFFNKTKFCSYVSFRKIELDGFVEFEGDNFLDNAEVHEVRAELNNEKINLEKESFFSLEQARLNKPDRLSFNSMKLRPCWFVNAEVRNLVLNDVEWQNLEIDIDRSGLNQEFNKLIEKNIRRPKESLIKACNQLADNAEANRRFEEAKLFRKQGIALQDYECHIHDSIDFKFHKDIWKEVCGDYPRVNEDGGKYYCLWHNPDKNKAGVFREQLEKRQKEKHSNFRGVVFPSTVEYNKEFELPPELDFSHATFQRRLAFENVTIHKLNLHNAHFEKDTELIIQNSICDGEINFNKTIFDGKLFLYGKDNYQFFINCRKALLLDDARFDKPEWINFRSVRLRPHYFVGVDASKFVFQDCEWKNFDGNRLNVRTEIEICTSQKKVNDRKHISSHRKLAEACNYIAINYEETRNFEESSTFRYMAMQTKRFEKPLHGWFWTLNWLYWLSSGYGERRIRAAVNLVLLLVLFGVLYASPLASFDYGEKSAERSADAIEQQIFCCAGSGERFHAMKLDEGFVHSLSVSAFQRPEPKPADTRTKFFIFLESILAPLQAALLALAIRRKFMR